MALLTWTWTSWDSSVKWGGFAPRLLLVTALSPREKLIKVGDSNNNNKDYLCHYTYANNSCGVFEGSKQLK